MPSVSSQLRGGSQQLAPSLVISQLRGGTLPCSPSLRAGSRGASESASVRRAPCWGLRTDRARGLGLVRVAESAHGSRMRRTVEPGRRAESESRTSESEPWSGTPVRNPQPRSHVCGLGHRGARTRRAAGAETVWIPIRFINASSERQPRSARSRSTPAAGPGTRSHDAGRRRRLSIAYSYRGKR